MAIVRPSFSQISSATATDVSTGLGNVPIARFSILNTLVRALSRALDSLYGYVDSTNIQTVPWSATGVNADAWSALWGVYRSQPSSALGQALIVVTGAATIPNGTVFTGTNSISYLSNGAVVAGSAGTYTINLTTPDAGSITNLPALSVLTMAATIPYVLPTASVLQMTGGADLETDASLVSRAQLVRSSPPHSGSLNDYVAWAYQVPLVTRAWSIMGAVPGNVIVYCMADAETATNGFLNGTNGCAALESRGATASGDQLTVANYIYPLRPVTSCVNVYTPVAQPLNIAITNTNPNTSATQAAVIAALQARILAIATPLGQTIESSDLSIAISSVLTSFNLAWTPTWIPQGNIATLGTVTFS